MRWKNGLTDLEKAKRKRLKREQLSEWHSWFAWFPVVVDETTDGHNVKAWLQTVQRRGHYYYGWYFSYREKTHEMDRTNN